MRKGAVPCPFSSQSSSLIDDTLSQQAQGDHNWKLSASDAFQMNSAALKLGSRRRCLQVGERVRFRAPKYVHHKK